MSLRWTIDDTHRTVDVIAEGEVTLADAIAFFDAMERAKALPYNKLLDGAHGHAAMTDEELMAVAARVRNLHSLGVIGGAGHRDHARAVASSCAGAGRRRGRRPADQGIRRCQAGASLAGRAGDARSLISRARVAITSADS